MIDKTDAPDGYIPVKTERLKCDGCSFLVTDEDGFTCTRPFSDCIADERADNEDVIFKLIHTPPAE